MLVILVFLVFSGGTSAYRIPKILTELSEDDFVITETKKEYANDAAAEPLLEPDQTEVLREGDIMESEMDKNEEAQLKSGQGIAKRNGVRDLRRLWLNNKIPFEIDAALQEHEAVIKKAFETFHNHTCLSFVAKDSSHKNWIKFVKKTGCWSYVGRQFTSQGSQELSLGQGCEDLGVILHEIMHAIGFYHEQSRPDRDSNVEIFWENIINDKVSNFERLDNNVVDTLGLDYEYRSVLHYKANAFTKNQKNTITAINDPTNTKGIGSQHKLTSNDIIKVNTLYQCGCLSSKSVGAEYGSILPNQNFKTSSAMGLDYYKAEFGRLNSPSAWCGNSDGEYLQVDVGKNRKLCSLASQGSGFFNDYVTSYSLKYSSDGQHWSQFKNADGSEKLFTGNSDQNTVVKQSLEEPTSTRFLRFYPKSYKGGFRCMRIALYAEALHLSGWSSWTPCNRKTCKKERQRYCSSDNKNVDCPTVNEYGVETQQVDCTHAQCTAPIHGHWNRWSSWNTECVACGVGKHERTRVCNDPAPSFGGNYCNGTNVTTVDCRTKHCGMGPDGCSFSKDFCTWKRSAFGQTNWIRHQFNTPSSKTGPSRDTTSLDGSGYYIYLEASGIASGTNAILQSPVQPGLSSERCLKFQYHMYDYYNGANYMGTLNVKIQQVKTGEKRTLKTISGNKGNQWHSEKVTFSSSSDYMVIIEAVRGTQFVSDIAVDDVSLLWGNCDNPTDVNPQPNTTPSPVKRGGPVEPVEDFTDFEKDFGTWQNSASQDRQFDWTRNSGSTETEYTGPSGDHTSRTGHYAYIETSSPHTIGQRARLVSKTFSEGFRCMSLWYHMNGINVWQLNVIKKTSSKEILLWSANKNEGDKWLHGTIPLTEGSGSFNIIIEGVRGHHDKGDIAIDDITVGRETCGKLWPSKNDPASKKSCLFDSTDCAWVDLPEGDMYWLSHSGSTGNSGTGPSSDQSGGFYMYINSASPRKNGDKALIASPYFNPGASGQCFKFWYHMYGTQVGTLNVYKETLSSPTRTNVLTKASSQGTSWQTASIFVNGNEKTRIVIEGIVGGQGSSDIAIDTVSFTPRNC